MPFNPDIHHRQSIRLRDYDYSWAGAYFVTTCVLQRECLFGEIVNGKMILNEAGRIVMATWTDLPNHYKHITLDESIVMPNHIHEIINIAEADFGQNGRVANPPLRNNIHIPGY
jgi:putative transposase